MKSQDNCGVCGQALIYGTDERVQQCTYCGESHIALIYCPEGHYICDSCHQRAGIDILKEVLETTKSTNPAEILETVMSHPSVPMHGPEHHSMIPAIIVAAVKNSGHPVPDDAVEKAIERGSKVPGGWCGFFGACGAGIGVGIGVSVLTGATPLTGETRSLANEATSSALSRIADRGARCCKRSSRMALETAVEFLESRMNISLGKAEKLVCRFPSRNRECIHGECAYYDPDIATPRSRR